MSILVNQINKITTHMADYINKIKSCTSYELQDMSICRGINAITSFFFKTPETGGIFDNGLFIVFICIFISFFLSSIYTVFLEDVQYLKNVRSKIVKSTNSVILVLRTFHALKESVDSNYALESEIIGRNNLENTNSLQELLQIGDTEIETKNFGEELIKLLPDHEVFCPTILESIDVTTGEIVTKSHRPMEHFADMSMLDKTKAGKNLHILYSKKAESFALDTREDKLSISSNDTKGSQKHSCFNKRPLESPSKARHNLFSNMRHDAEAKDRINTKGGIFARRKMDRSKAKSATTVGDKKGFNTLPAWK